MAKPKFDYSDPKFYKVIEEMAQKGMTDRNIAWALVKEFGEGLTPQKFSEYKNETDEGGNPTERAKRISEALARGREKINLLVRDTYLKAALGGKRVKTTVKRYVDIACSCGGADDMCPHCGGSGKVLSTQKAIMQESDMELPPNIQALSTWLFNHDEEWRKSIIEGKKLDITTNGKDINQVTIFELPDNGRDGDK